MSLHPIKILEHVIEEYRDYLLTEFRAKDPDLRAALERELGAPGFLAREPFYQAHRPFKDGKRWRDVPLDARLADVMVRRTGKEHAYIHQSQAIDELLSPEARPVVVTTGTGSGKTEAFLLPVIQNAFEDSVRFKKPGLTAILIYPMNALANDQEIRIKDYLAESGFAGAIRVEKYDRSTSQKKREEMRENPPHILLTNYMMLEYLLVRPADREDIFANHRCRFVVLDEVHTYRGVLGSNIALLVRRLRVHLAHARHDWMANVPDADQSKRYPSPVMVGTSATIKSLAEENLPHEELLRQRDEAVRQFFGSLTGVEPATIQVFGEELQEIETPAEAAYPARPGVVDIHSLALADVEKVRSGLCRLAGLAADTPLVEAGKRYRLLWDLNRWLISRPMSTTQIMSALRTEVSERTGCSDEELRSEVEAALVLGAALPDGTPGALRLRAHQLIRGGWKFYRCVNPDCGRLYPMGEERCGACNHPTAPLYLCRNCGAHYLRFVGVVDEGTLRPSADETDGPEWLLYDPSRFEGIEAIDEDDSDETTGTERARGRKGSKQVPTQIRQRPVLDGSFNPDTQQFSVNPDQYSLRATLAPARARCLCCGGTAGSRNVITPVALGTSAAVKVLSEGLAEALAEANRNRPGHDGKERLLIFSDSRQDAAHQARFIVFASRYDRMRRRLFQLLQSEPSLTIQRVVELLGEAGVANRDNPQCPEQTDWIPDEVRERIRVWEEAPLLDDISVNAGYRATLVNLGLVGVSYHRLDEYIQARGESIAKTLGIGIEELEYVCRVILDEMRTRGALSRPMLQYHPAHIACPSHFQAAEWERRIKHPHGYPLTEGGQIITYMDRARVPSGISFRNAWRKPDGRGRSPSLQRLLCHLMDRFGGNEPDDQTMVSLLDFLFRGNFLIAADLFGARDRVRLLQVNADVVALRLLDQKTRLHCNVCGYVFHGAQQGIPCPDCHGTLQAWPDTEVQQNRIVRRVRQDQVVPLVAGEHTAQITTDARATLEENFKAPQSISPVNVLACSPTLEMGIDVGGLDAVIMRNVPPRPDNYAQRGGRAGRRSRVGLVVGYARSTPHDQYFYDRPHEMIAGEVPTPCLSLANRDVLVRHLYAIAFGLAEPGLAGRMVDYVSPDGNIKQEALDAFIEGIRSQSQKAIDIAREAWGGETLAQAGLADATLQEHLDRLPERIRYAVDCTARQIVALRFALDNYARNLQGRHAGVRAGDLVARLLGLPTDTRRETADADDRSAGYPLRRFAEFGLLPGYEFPAEPAALRLLGDEHEEDALTVTRRFGIGQFQPEAHVYARRKRWKVIGLDMASPWNPQSQGPTWSYRVCGTCGLRYNADQPHCPRCRTASPGPAYPAYDFAGFLAKREERPILDEEERFAVRNLVSLQPQWDGDVIGRWTLANGWALRLSRNEEIRWLNEGQPPKPSDFQSGKPFLHQDATGYLVCPSCGRLIDPPPAMQNQGGGRRNARSRAGGQQVNGHADTCPQQGQAPQPLAIATSGHGEVLRLMAPVPSPNRETQWVSWGLSLGYALLNGIQHHFGLDARELDFEFEGPWVCVQDAAQYGMLSLAFIDPTVGGSGYLARIAENFNHVAQRSVEHLDHPGCETACYRCLKAYQNQRYHDSLAWPQTIPALEEISVTQPASRPLQTGDIDDPRPWIEAYTAGVGSPLEFRFLQLFERHAFRPERQVPVAPSEGMPPISVCDFAVPARRLAIYIDGAAFHAGLNLRRDKFIRDRLRQGNPPWTVVELRAQDLAKGESLVREIESL